MHRHPIWLQNIIIGIWYLLGISIPSVYKIRTAFFATDVMSPFGIIEIVEQFSVTYYARIVYRDFLQCTCYFSKKNISYNQNSFP